MNGYLNQYSLLVLIGQFKSCEARSNFINTRANQWLTVFFFYRLVDGQVPVDSVRGAIASLSRL